MVFAIQVLILFFIFKSIKYSEDGSDWVKPDVNTMILRLLVSYLLHIQNMSDVIAGYRKLKFIKGNADFFEERHILPAFLCT